MKSLKGERALVIEVSSGSESSIHQTLAELGLEADYVSDGKLGLMQALREDYQLVVIDLELPSIGGLEVCRKLREAKPTQPIMLLADEENETKTVIGFELGADEFVQKPFARLLFQARTRALLRRHSQIEKFCNEYTLAPRRELVIDDLRLDLDKRHVYIGKTKVNLSPTEFDFLVFFAKHPGQVFSRDELVDAIWGGGPKAYEQNVRSHISNLRFKLKTAGAQREYIANDRGFGYRFCDKMEDDREK